MGVLKKYFGAVDGSRKSLEEKIYKKVENHSAFICLFCVIS